MKETEDSLSLDDIADQLPADLPPGLVRLVRQIARDCAAPGRYTITLEVPPHGGRPRTAVISRLERIRILEIKQE